MKKKNKILIILLAVITLITIIGFAIYDNYKTNQEILKRLEELKSHDYDFEVKIHDETEHKKELVFTYNGKDYYYGNTKFELSIYNKDINVFDRYSLEKVITNDIIKFDDMLSKAKKVESAYNGGSKVYDYNNFKIIVCNTLDGNKDIIIGDEKITPDEFCK